MKNTAKQWLTDRASPAGMLACGLRSPDGQTVCRSIEDILPEITMQKLLGQFEQVRATLFAEPLSPRWCTWAFEHGLIRFVPRPDGWVLGLVIRAESDAQPRLDPLSAEFLALDLGS
jgi:hypothetical protein